jgi:hypothetical protein
VRPSFCGCDTVSMVVLVLRSDFGSLGESAHVAIPGCTLQEAKGPLFRVVPAAALLGSRRPLEQASLPGPPIIPRALT